VGFQIVSQLGVTDQDEIYASNLYSLTEFPASGPLSNLDTSDSMGADAYPLAYVAVQYLLASKGMSVAALGDVYSRLEDGASFEEAFAAVFGEPLDQFYADFEALRAQLQQVTQLPDDFWPIEEDALPAPVVLGDTPPQVGRGQQMVVVGKTRPLTDCDAELRLGVETVRRETYANGEGEVFWLITVPVDAPVGPATLSVACDAMPVTAQLAIT
jgi:hypothetical protein